MDNPNKNRFKKISRYLILSLKEGAIFYLLTLLAVCVIAAATIFYLNIINPPQASPESYFIKINKNLYQTIYDRLNAREINIRQGIGQEYPNVFK